MNAVSDNKALALAAASANLRNRLGYGTCHDCPRWTEQVEAILARLPIQNLEHLVTLLCDGPFERPDS